jgi:hypothetical protein
MTEQLKDYERVEREKWQKKADTCPLRSDELGLCLISEHYRLDFCSFEICIFNYWNR